VSLLGSLEGCLGVDDDGGGVGRTAFVFAWCKAEQHVPDEFAIWDEALGRVPWWAASQPLGVFASMSGADEKEVMRFQSENRSMNTDFADSADYDEVMILDFSLKR